MKKELISKLHKNFEECAQDKDGVEYWTARELQTLLNYDRWENFSKVILKAKDACKNSNVEVPDHFRDVTKMVKLGSGSKRKVDDPPPHPLCLLSNCSKWRSTQRRNRFCSNLLRNPNAKTRSYRRTFKRSKKN